MADLPPSDHPEDSTNGKIEGLQERSAPPEPPLEIERTLADSEQTLADSDQTLSDADQTGTDSDQTSSERDQLAADRDQAASDHDLAHGVDPSAHEFSHDIRQRTTLQREQVAREREETAQARLSAGEARDALASARDVAALARDQAAAARDIAIAQFDRVETAIDEAQGDPDEVVTASAQRKHAAARRAAAAEHRLLAAEDRRLAARDRDQAAHERLRALVDREALARQVAIGETDALTGARTRAAGLTDLDHEINRCRRTEARLVVVYVDIIGLKIVNDTEGHSAGDALLKSVATLLRAHLRGYDLIIRIGGDEFVCAMSNMPLDDVRQRFEAIVAAPHNAPIRIGLAELEPDETAGALIHRADAELLDRRNRLRAV